MSMLSLKNEYKEDLENASEMLSRMGVVIQDNISISEKKATLTIKVDDFIDAMELFDLDIPDFKDYLANSIDLNSFNEFYQKYLDKAEVFLEKIDKSIDNIYNLNKHYSNFKEDTLAVNVKLYSQKFPSLEEIKIFLKEKGFEKEDIEEFVTDECIQGYVNTHNEDSWESFKEMGSADFEFLGSAGRMDGYAVFKTEANNVQSFEAFSKEIESLHKSVLEGLSVEDIVSRLIDDEIILLSSEKESRKKEEDYQNNRPYKETITPTNEFSLSCNSMSVTFWDNDTGFIESADVHFEKENLTLKDVVSNLEDDSFGVKSIEGGENIEVYQYLNKEKHFLDTDEKITTKIRELVFDGEIYKTDEDLNDLVEVELNVKENIHDNSFLNKLVVDFEKNIPAVRFAIEQHNYYAEAEIRETATTLEEINAVYKDVYSKSKDMYTSAEIILIDKDDKKIDLSVSDYINNKIDKDNKKKTNKKREK